ncbi:hypothetical protein GCM10027190_19400 [Spirosoma areae]
MIRPKKLIQVEPFNVVLLWSNNEIRSNDFSEKVEQWKHGLNKQLAKLANRDVFMSATIHNNALAFKKIKLRVPGIAGTQPLDLDPDVMFQESVKLGRTVSTGKSLKTHRKKLLSTPPIGEIRFSSQGSDLDLGGKSYHFSSACPLIQIGDELIEIDT